ncbi:glutamate--tRNA ligase [Mycoplasma sp. NEAQ87857]|uniref:glutamate--tRNA ligase n=1 Tax=Mycoplasma sp. NEAQ87857 TaxID=2683967 RepID=UPI0013177541|nr:glutamate--tRNA ligase [Mycoplasma sp. NEAQ87857]QGZ97308.1 glutamate--tRNA ligase [Mycoplasma sp. NEAQ87857]
MKKIRTRYAPSPTGYLHIGGARTALFCYLYAKHFDGDFVFRLEDTDVKRNVEGGEASQLDNLAWLGIIPDESPYQPNEKYGKYRQSEKLDRYKAVANELLAKGLAYKAYDNAEELQAQKDESDAKGIPSFKYDPNWLQISDQEKQKRDANGEYSIRLKMPKDKIYQWNDIVRGEISFNSSDLADWVIYKSDGYPTYNFAVVIDDHDMEISHILRGEEHIGNTPKQLALYDYLNWEVPSFGHLTIITNMEGKKLSKRDTTLKQFIEDYKNEGYMPEGIFNFLALLGWTDKEAKELLTKEELITRFDPARLSKSPSKFDISKMNWFSKQYLKNKSNQEIANLMNLTLDDWSELFIETFKQNAVTITDLNNELKAYDDKSINKLEFNEEELIVIKQFASLLKDQLNQNKDFSVELINNLVKEVQSITGFKGKKLFMPIRKATTMVEHGPELAKAIYLFGQDVILERLAQYEN